MQAPHEGRSDHDAVRDLADLGGLSRASRCPPPRTPAGRCGGGRARPPSPRRRRGLSLSGHAHAGDGVDETARPGTDARHPFLGARRCDQQHVSTPAASASSCPRIELLDREVGQDGAADPGGGKGAGHALVPGAVHDVVVRHHRDRDRRLGARRCRRAPRRAPCPVCSARSAASWITGPSIIGSEKGMPTSTASAPAATTAARRLAPVVGHAAHEIRESSSLRPRSRRLRSSFSRSGIASAAEDLADLGDVLVAATRERDQHGRARRAARRCRRRAPPRPPRAPIRAPG